MLSNTLGINPNTAIKVLLFSQEILFQYLQLVSLILNLTLCRDLIQTLQNPFEPTRFRVQFYIIISILLPTILLAAIWTISD